MAPTREPYRAEHDASVSRAMRDRGEVPGFSRLLGWFVGRWVEEVPHSIHAAGVEWSTPGRVVRSDGSGVTDPGGGNELGAPRFNGAFRTRVLEGRTWQTEHPVSDGVAERGDAYQTPMHHTVEHIARRRPLTAAWLRALGRAGGDWRQVGQLGLMIDERGHRIPLPDEYAEAITRDALRLAWIEFREEPTA